jgi:hypothetical protein
LHGAIDRTAKNLNFTPESGYLFKHRDPAELYKPLNRPEAIAKHPIASHFATFYDWGIGDLVGDRLWAHPKGRDP